MPPVLIADRGRVPRRQIGHPSDRHILLGISHASNDPARHRTFEIRAAYDVEAGVWIASVGEQNLNEQRGAWDPNLMNANGTPGFLTAAACIGDAVARLITIVDQDAQDVP